MKVLMNQEIFKRGIAEIIDEKSFSEKLKSGKKLRIKMGMDPTRPDLHLGHAVGLKKLRALQDDGHKIICIVGDYTARVGDPSGKNSTRPILSDREIDQNAKTYLDQVGKILDVKKTELRKNSEWFSKMKFADILQLAGKFTVAQILERDDFENRYKNGIDIGLHELLYPLMQAYDSVVVEADVEFGGSDQKFNMLAGRVLQKKMGQKPQDIITVEILPGLDGKEKMSKSLDNYVGVCEKSGMMFGKIMSIPDQLIVPYFELCTDKLSAEISKIKKSISDGENPRDIKASLAKTIVEFYHSKKEAEAASQEFESVFSKGNLPEEIAEFKLSGNFEIILLLTNLGAISSNSEGRRLVEQNAVKIDGVTISDINAQVATHSGMVIQVGKKRFYKIK